MGERESLKWSTEKAEKALVFLLTQKTKKKWYNLREASDILDQSITWVWSQLTEKKTIEFDTDKTRGDKKIYYVIYKKHLIKFLKNYLKCNNLITWKR